MSLVFSIQALMGSYLPCKAIKCNLPKLSVFPLNRADQQKDLNYLYPSSTDFLLAPLD